MSSPPPAIQATPRVNSVRLKCTGGDSSALGWPDRHLNWSWQSAVWAIDQRWTERGASTIRGSRLRAGSFAVLSSHFWGAAGETYWRVKHFSKMALQREISTCSVERVESYLVLCTFSKTSVFFIHSSALFCRCLLLLGFLFLLQLWFYVWQTFFQQP